MPPFSRYGSTQSRLSGGGSVPLRLRLRVGRGRNRYTLIVTGRPHSRLAEVMETAWRLYVRKLAVRGRNKRAKVTEDPAEMTELLRDAEARDTVTTHGRYPRETRVSRLSLR